MMRHTMAWAGTSPLLLVAACCCGAGEPLRLHPDNPHYFLFRGKPTLLITSGEHYGAVLNLDFDYVKYLDTLAADGLNCTRLFSGAYVEPAGAFNITRNTLAPEPGRFICPWARSETPGYANGGGKFDLSRWDTAYFTRLRDFVQQASRRGIVVEMNLFCPFYGDEQWRLSPMNAANNVNGIGAVTREQAYTPDGQGGLLHVQEELVRRLVAELRDFDNLYYEVMNEPYIRAVPLAWQHHIVDTIVAAEASLPARHLISQNIANGKAKVDAPHPAVSILNFHYAWPPDTVAMNYGLGRPIGDNETGFKGTGDAHYRREGWSFILAGGALYNHLDYSFAAGFEGGTFQYPATQPGGGSPALRRQLRYLAEFMRGFDVVRMAPRHDLLKSVSPEGLSCFVLAEEGKQYGIYLHGAEGRSPTTPARLSLALPPGDYVVQWTDTLTGTVAASEHVARSGAVSVLLSPAFAEDIALAIRRARP